MKVKVYGLHFFALDYQDNAVLEKVYPKIFTKPKDAEALADLWQSFKTSAVDIHAQTKVWIEENRQYWVEDGVRPTPETWAPFQTAINDYRAGLKQAALDALTPEQKAFKADYYHNSSFNVEIVEFDLE